MDKTEESKEPKTRKKKIKKALKVKLSKVTILAGFVTGIFTYVCAELNKF